MATNAKERMTSLTVIIATYNRAPVLRSTLEALCSLDRKNLDVTFVVVDNNSSDDTASVIAAFVNRLPLTHLFQPVQGKSNALNLALDTVDLGEVVVFTDDDVVPHKDWLQAIAASLRDYPEYSVFGGRIDICWPDGFQPPDWAMKNGFLRETVWGEHDRGQSEAAYPAHRFPHGANWWFRRKVLASGIRFRTDLGAGDLPMGEEIVFALTLAERGWCSLYYPTAVVGHLGDNRYFDFGELKGRMLRWGRGFAHMRGFPDHAYFEVYPKLWRLRRCASIIRFGLLPFFACLIPNKQKRVRKMVEGWIWHAYHMEALCLSLRNSQEVGDAQGL